MKVTTEKLENRQLGLTIEVEPERVDAAVRRAARKLSERGKIPGYRKGKAPLQVVKRAYGEDALLEEAAEDLAQKVYLEALEQAGIKPYAQGHLDDVKLKPDVVFKLTVPLEPVVDLGTYRDIRLPETEASVSEEQVDTEIERIRHQRAIWKPTERPAVMGDAVVLTYKGMMDGREVFKQDSQPVKLAEASGPLPQFAQQLVGAIEGETREFSLGYPEDWPDKERAGQPVAFRVTVELIREEELPELNDDLAKLVGEYDTLDQLRAKVRDTLLNGARADADGKYADDAIDKVVGGSTIEFPPILVEGEMDDLLEGTGRQLERQGQSLDTYLSLSNQDKDQFRESLRERSERNVKRALVLGQAAENERITVAPEAIEEQMAIMRSAYQRSGAPIASLGTPDAIRRVYSRLLAEKTVERIVAIAKGQAPELPALPTRAAPTESAVGIAPENTEGAEPSPVEAAPDAKSEP